MLRLPTNLLDIYLNISALEYYFIVIIIIVPYRVYMHVICIIINLGQVLFIYTTCTCTVCKVCSFTCWWVCVCLCTMFMYMYAYAPRRRGRDPSDRFVRQRSVRRRYLLRARSESHFIVAHLLFFSNPDC